MLPARLTYPLIPFLLLCSCGSQSDPLAEGKRFFDQGKYADADLQFRRALQRDPNSAQAALRLGMSALKQEKIREAYQFLSRAADLRPDDEEIALQFSNLAMDAYVADPSRPRKLYDQLTRVAAALVRKNPENFEGLRIQGTLALFDQRTQEGIGFLNRALKAKPGHAEATLLLAQALMQNGQAAEGERLATALLASNKEFGPMYDALALHYARSKRSAEAEKVLLAKVANFPGDPVARLRLAAFYSDTGKGAALDAMLSEVVKLPRGYLAAGDFFEARKEPAKALEFYERGAAAVPADRSGYQARMARVHLAQGRADDARAAVAAALEADPKNPDAKAIGAAIALQTGSRGNDLEAAVKSLQELAAARPDDIEIRASLADALLRMGSLEEARRQLVRARELKPNHARTILMQAQLAINDRQFKEALRMADQLRELQPADTAPRVLRAIALNGLQRPLDARRELTSILAENPNSVEAQVEMAILNMSEGRVREAEALFAKVHKANPGNARALQGMVASQISQNRSEEAVRQLQTELARDPKSPGIRSTLASAAVRSRNFDLAIRTLEQLSAEFPDAATYRTRLAEAHLIKGDPAASVGVLQQLAAKQAADPDVALNLAFALEAAGRMEEALTAYRRALKLAPNDAVALNNAAYLMATLGKNLDEAIQFAERARGISKDGPGVLDTLGYVYLKKGMTDSALQIFAGISKKHPQVAAFRYHHAMALMAKGDNIKARAELQAALAAKPSATESKSIKELLAKIG